MQVRKSYEERRSRRRARGQKRAWRLKRMAMEVEDDNAPSAPGRGREQRGAPAGTRQEQDMERFMQVGSLPHLAPPLTHCLCVQRLLWTCQQRTSPEQVCFNLCASAICPAPGMICLP